MDNVSVSPGTGASIATDDIGGVQYQRVKITQGIDGVSDGDVSSTNPLHIKLSDGTDVAAVVPLGTAVVAANPGLVTNTVIHGLNSGGGGSYVDVKVNPSGSLMVESTTTSLVPGTGATNLGKAEDAAHTTGDVGVLALAVRKDVATSTPTSADGDYAALTTDSKGNLRIHSPLGNPGTVDSFGHLITGGRNNQIDIQFYKNTPQNLLTVTTTNSGTATQSAGGALFSTSTNTSGTAKGVTTSTAAYSAGGEMYAMFTAAWANAGVAASFQRIGLYDDNNGFFIGYEGTSFGITTRYAGADTSVAKASWSVDTLTGAAGSLFTRNGVPEAIDLTFANVFRVRFGWLGEAPVIWEVLSPDGQWVIFHIIKQPNTSANPSIQNPDLPMTVHVSKTSAGATNLTLQTYCWGAGCTLSRIETSDVVMQSAATATGNGTNMVSEGYGTAVFNVTGTFVATITFEASDDAGTTWNTISATAIGGDIATTATTTGIYRVSCTGIDLLRARISAYTSGSVTVVGHATNAPMSNKIVKLASGTNTFGKLAANDGVDIGDVTLNNTSLPVAGIAAHDAAISGNPVRIAGRALTSDYTAVAAGDVADLATTTTGKLVVYPFALPGQTWGYAAGSGGIVNTTGVTVKAAAGAGVRNYVTTADIVNSHATVSTDVQIRDGASGTVLWRGWAQAVGGGYSLDFNPPLRGSANTLIEVACGTTGAAVYVNLGGFTAAE